MIATVNEDANFLVQLFIKDKWHTLTEEYSVSAATQVAVNLNELMGIGCRVTIKRSDNMILCQLGANGK
jgi:hypothetical protein